jgi:hypothetical protein
MARRARVISYFPLPFLCLLVPIVLTAQQQHLNLDAKTTCGCSVERHTPNLEEIIVWKVGSPYQGETPNATIPPDLERSAQKMGFKITVKAFPAMGFAQQFFEALEKGQEPDVLAIDNYGIINGITTPLGDFTGIASDETIRAKLVEVTESLNGLEGLNQLGNRNGWEFLTTTSKHSKAAKSLALRSPECNQRWTLTPLTQDLQENAIPIARAYLQGDRSSLAAWEDPERLHTDVEDPKQRNVAEIKGCGYWGDERLAFVPIVASYESARALGQISLLLILRKQDTQWQLLTASTDPISVLRFPEGIPKLVSLLEEIGTPREDPFPANLLAPEDGQYPVPAQGQRFGDFVWQPSASTDVVAQIIEFAYNDDARLFLKFFSGNSLANEQISDGQLWTTRGLWRWRVWSISDSGAISFSESRTFSH